MQDVVLLFVDTDLGTEASTACHPIFSAEGLKMFQVAAPKHRNATSPPLSAKCGKTRI
jgi:hypothetical protein